MSQHTQRRDAGFAAESVRSRPADHRAIAMTINDAIEHTGIGRTVLYGLLKSGQIKAVKNGRATLILADSLRDYVANLPPAKFGSTEQS